MTKRKVAKYLPMIACYVTLISFVSCGYDRFGELSPSVKEDVSANARLDLLMQKYSGAAYTVADDLVFAGWVTANDFSGNFFRTFIIQDRWGAVEIDAGFYDLHNEYPVGQRVVVRAKGLAAGQYNGVIQIGRTVNPYSSYRVESFSHPAVMGGYISVNGIEPGAVNPETREISSLTASDCGKLLKIEDLLLHEDERGSTWAFPGDSTTDPQEGVRTFSDSEENIVAVVTSGYAGFAGEYIPEGTVSLTGILMYGKFGASKERFALKLRDLKDVE